MQIRSFCLESGRALPHSKTWPYLFPAIDKSQAIFHVRRTCHPEQSEGSRSWSSVPKLRKRVTEKGSFVVYATQDDSARKYASQFTLTTTRSYCALPPAHQLVLSTARERFCSCRGLLLRCPAETREHRRSPDSARKGWSQIRAYSEPEYRTADRLWSSALPVKPRPRAARFLPSSPLAKAAGLDCRVVSWALRVRLDNVPRDDALAAHYPRMRQKQSQQQTRATVSIS